MTFLSDLARLREAATKSVADYVAYRNGQAPCINVRVSMTAAEFTLHKYFMNHSEAIEELVKVALPLAHYSRMRDEKPMNGMDDAIHSIHVGTEWEAELTQSQLRALRQALEKLNRSE